MNRRSFLGALAGAPALAAVFAACGDDNRYTFSYEPGDNPDVILKITSEGGFVPAGVAFVNLPSLLISGDGRAFAPGPMIEIFPGPLLPAILERTITDEGIRKVLQLADDAGLLAPPPDYLLPGGFTIADAPDTVVVINVNGKVYEHRAYALGFDVPEGEPSTPARDNLNKFVTTISDLAKVTGDANIGDEQPFVPTRYRLQSLAIDPAQYTDPEPTVVAWPDGTGVVLAESPQCATVAAVAVDDLLISANQLTFFEEGGTAYQLYAVAVLPGDATC